MKDEGVLERIAITLERIAFCLEQKYGNSLSEVDSDVIEEKPNPENDYDSATEEGCAENNTKNRISETGVIEEFLAKRNISIKIIPPENAADDMINSISEFLGNNYNSLKELLSRIKRNMQKGGFFTLSLKDYPQKEVSNVCQFCTRLYEIAFLEQYKYFKSPQFLIKAKTTTLPTAQNFFSGKWLERYVVISVQKAINELAQELQRQIDFSYLLNPQIILPNGDDFELDLIFQVDGTFYWIEAKSGDYQQHIGKYSKMAKIMNLDYRHSIMVLTDITGDKSQALTSLFSMTVCSLSQLQEHLIDLIRNDCITSGCT